MDGYSLVETATGSWGPAALVAVATILFFTGKIVAKPTVDRLLKSKDEQLEVQKAYYEGRISDIAAAHKDQVQELRTARDNYSTALQGAVDNVSKLIAQVDELQELSRAATPAILGARQAAEGRSNDNTG